MAESAEALISAMKDDVEVWLSGREVALEPKYGAAIAAVGAVPFLAELFRRLGDATLSRWLIRLAFAWKDLPFLAWKEILRRVSDDAPAVYQFVTFVAEFLAVDIVRLVGEDPAVHETARIFVAARFPNGGPKPGSEWVREVLQDHGVDMHRMWRRLAEEGAPMRVDLR